MAFHLALVIIWSSISLLANNDDIPSKGYVIGALEGAASSPAALKDVGLNEAVNVYKCQEKKLHEQTRSLKQTATPSVYVLAPISVLKESYWEAETAALSGQNVFECILRKENFKSTIENEAFK